MKKLLILFLALLIPALAAAQIKVTRTGGTGYFLQTAQGDTLHLSGATPFYNQRHTALTEGVNYAGENDVEVFLRSNIVDRITADFGFYDVEYIEVEKELPLFMDLNEEIRFIGGDPPQNRILSTAYTQADSVTVQHVCIGESFTERTSIMTPVFYHEHYTDCTQDMEVRYQFWEGGVSTDTTNIIPSFVFSEEIADVYFEDFESPDSTEWDTLWGNIEYSFTDGRLIVDLPEKSIARITWNRIPEHTNIRWRVIEEVHSSHSTGFHIGGRTSAVHRGYAVENYIQGTGMGISLFHDGTWTNPVTCDMTWEYGVPVEYTTTIIDDTITVEWDGGQCEYSSAEIGGTPPGVFALGSTGAGLYILHEIEIEILD